MLRTTAARTFAPTSLLIGGAPEVLEACDDDVGTEDAGAKFEVFVDDSGKLPRLARLVGFEDFPSEGLHLTLGAASFWLMATASAVKTIIY